MACNSLNIPNCLGRSESSKDLRNRSTIVRSFSDNSLVRVDRIIRNASVQRGLKTSRSMAIFPTSRDTSAVEKPTGLSHDEDISDFNEGEEVNKRANWVERLMEIRSHWRRRQQEPRGDEKDGDFDETEAADEERDVGDCDCEECEVSYDQEEQDGEENKPLDREAFSRFLREVSWSDTRSFSQLAFLCNMAYVIQDIRPKDLRRHFGLRFVTSSMEKKAEAETPKDSPPNPAANKLTRRASSAYEIAASAASYVQSRGANTSLSASEPRDECVKRPEVAAYVAASTMTAVVAAGEKEKSETAKNLQSLHSSPCEWFICDDLSTYTRCFVIQGSDSLASWQANLFFEPTTFEDTDCLVHRGIYEAAKGIYEQFMPEIIKHLRKHGERAKLQFTGHSLGGSLSLLVHLMLLSRGVVDASVLRPVVTFGSPFVFCGGGKMLEQMGVSESQIHCVVMHRDIVPRAFSCNYPNHVINVLKRLNGTFRSHPCLMQNKFLYSPMGKIFLLQPDESSSPPHPLLPEGSALYALDTSQRGFSPSILRAFLNNPHPLETLSDPTAYGSDGTILRDHDSSNYLKTVNGVLRLLSKPAIERTVKKESNVLWPLLASPSPHSWTCEGHVADNNWLKEEIMSGV